MFSEYWKYHDFVFCFFCHFLSYTRDLRSTELDDGSTRDGFVQRISSEIGIIDLFASIILSKRSSAHSFEGFPFSKIYLTRPTFVYSSSFHNFFSTYNFSIPPLWALLNMASLWGRTGTNIVYLVPLPSSQNREKKSRMLKKVLQKGSAFSRRHDPIQHTFQVLYSFV